MNSGKAQGKRQMASALRMGLLGILGLMILSFTLGQTAMADDSKLKIYDKSHLVEGKYREVIHTLNADERQKALHELFPAPTVEGMKQLFKTLNIAQIASGFVAARVKAANEENPEYVKTLQKEVPKMLKELWKNQTVKEDVFKNQEDRFNAVVDLVKDIANLPENQLEKNDIMTRLLTEEVLAKFGLTKTQIAVADAKDKEKDRFAKHEEDMKKWQEKRDADQKAWQEEFMKTFGTRRDGLGKEVLDQEMLTAYRKMCAEKGKKKDGTLGKLADIMDAITKLASQPPASLREEPKNNNDDLLTKALLAKLGEQDKKNRDNQVPQIPQAKSEQPNLKNESGPLATNAPPVQDDKDEQPKAQLPPYQSSPYQMPKFSSDLPDGFAALRAANRTDDLSQRIGSMAKLESEINGNTDLFTMISKRAKRQSLKRDALAEKANLTTQKRNLERQLAPFMKEAKAAISGAEEAERDALGKLQDVDGRLQDTQQNCSRQTDERSQEYCAGRLSQLQQEKRQATQQKNQVDNAVASETKKNKGQIAYLKELIGDLDEKSTELGKHIAQLDSEEEAATAMINAKVEQEKQARMMAAQGPGYRTTNAANSGGGRRGSRGSSVGAATGTAMRGSLGKDGAQRGALRGGDTSSPGTM